ncbi:MAG: peroxiredoxin [Gammaproteobacteria bacterium]|nr:peroxiredoxin [Gammaproteobacteria bacterium]
MDDSLLGKRAPDFELPATGEQSVRLSDLKGQNVVLYFYPRDNTSGCTTEGLDFGENIEAFKAANTVIFGLSKDSVKSHEGFKEKQDFPFELLSDENSDVCEKYLCFKLKKNYGKEYMGIERSTFLINAEGEVVQEWRKVKVPEHVLEVLAAAKEL